MTILVTGGAGFIGANFVLKCIKQLDEPIINLDKLTYAGNLDNLSSINDNTNHIFIKGNIADESIRSINGVSKVTGRPENSLGS